MTLTALSPLDPPQLVRERAFDDLRRAIITGGIAPGTRLIERELCEALGISRASVREVIRQLESERLVSVEPRKGPTVSRLTRREAVELYEIRCIFEMLLVERFTECADDAAIAGMKAIYAQISAASEVKDTERLVRLMLELDEHMNRTVQHSVVGDLLSHLNARISVLRVASMTRPGRILRGREEIGEIVAAVEARDSKGAAKAMRNYIENARDDALQALAEGD